MTPIAGLGSCWRAAERIGDLQLTWHDATPTTSRHARDDSRPGIHAVVVGYRRPKSRLLNDCSGGKIRSVDAVSLLYTRNAAEAEAAYAEALAGAQAPRPHQREAPAIPLPAARYPWDSSGAVLGPRQEE